MCFTRASGCCEAPSVADARLQPSMRTLPSLLSARASAKSAQDDPTDTCTCRLLMPCFRFQLSCEGLIHAGKKSWSQGYLHMRRGLSLQLFAAVSFRLIHAMRNAGQC